MSANQPTAAWAGIGDPLVVVAGHLVSPQDGFGEIGRMPNGDLRRPSQIEVAGPVLGLSFIQITRFGSRANFAARRANGSEVNPTAITNGQELGALAIIGFDGTAFGDAASVLGRAAENWAAGAHGTSLRFSTVPVGSVALTSRWEMQAAGHLVAATDNVVNIGASDDNRPQSIFVGSGGVQVTASGGGVTSRLSAFGNPADPSFALRRARGTEAIPTAVQTNDTLGQVLYLGHDGVAFMDVAAVSVSALENFVPGANGTFLSFGTTLGGQAIRANRWQIQPNFNAVTDNTLDMGGVGANRARDLNLARNIVIGGALNHVGATAGFYATAPIAQQAGVAVTAAGIHAACVALGLFTA